MENFDVLKDVSERTGGDIYLGVVGPVRTGKSTFIKRFMETLVLSNIEDFHERSRALDETPQSGAGRTIMTSEPKFIPAEAVDVAVADGISMRVRLVDCVGYGVEDALGFMEEDEPRMVNTPWFDEPIPFNEAAELGTRKVISEHSTIGLIMTADGSFGDLPRENFVPAEQRVVSELKELGKPFVIILNSAHPDEDAALDLARELSEQYQVSVMPVDVPHMDYQDILDILNASLYEFPVSEIHITLPQWVEELPAEHALRQRLERQVGQSVANVSKVRDISQLLTDLQIEEITGDIALSNLDLGQGAASIKVDAAGGLFYQVLSEYAGMPVEGEHTILRVIRQFGRGAREWEKIAPAMTEVLENGYGVVTPQLDEMYLEEPELIKQGGHFGVKLRASAPSYHIIRANVSAELTPLIGTEKQCEELVRYIMNEFEDDPQKLWSTNIFGKSLHDLVSEEISGKLTRMPEHAQAKLAETLQRIVNDSGGGLIFIII
ncbi:MAG: stage IV sporulation protein A [Firmicutes bacterium]|nr:stage IV sporulation protein A [Bacillota bacterium]